MTLLLMLKMWFTEFSFCANYLHLFYTKLIFWYKYGENILELQINTFFFLWVFNMEMFIVSFVSYRSYFFFLSLFISFSHCNHSIKMFVCSSQNLVDSIEKKEQELNSFRDMLNKTRDALKQSEDAVQVSVLIEEIYNV